MSSENINYCFKALNEGLHEAMKEDSKIIFLGEDILDPYGGAFKVAKGLSAKFPDQVYTTPISEAAILGIANGLALRGYVPIVEIMFGDFIALAFDQILNHLSKFKSMYNDQVEPHLVIRTPMGGYRGYGPTHSQSLEKFLIGIPNIKVLYPSHIHPLKTMIKKSIVNDNGPIIFLENKSLYSIPNQYHLEKIEYFDAAITDNDYPAITLSLNEFTSADVTIVCYGGMTPMVMKEAIKILTDEEIFCEVVVLSQISQINITPIADSVNRSKRLITVEEGTLEGGVGNEIITCFVERYLDLLESNPIRIAALDDAIPSSKELEINFLPSPQDIRDAVIKILNKS